MPDITASPLLPIPVNPSFMLIRRWMDFTRNFTNMANLRNTIRTNDGSTEIRRDSVVVANNDPISYGYTELTDIPIDGAYNNPP